MIVPLIMIVVLSVLAIFITNSNQTIVQIIVFGHTIKSSTGFMLVGALGVGLLLGILSMLPSVLKRGFDLLRHKEELAQMKQKEAAKKA
jgi:uncharacterized integral membrane protein